MLLIEIASGNSVRAYRLTGHSSYHEGDREAAWRQRVLHIAHRENYPEKYVGCAESIRAQSYGLQAGIEYPALI